MADNGINIDDFLQFQIGGPGDPIRRIRQKSVCAQIDRMLKEQHDTWPAELRLRAYLAIGRTPPPEF